MWIWFLEKSSSEVSKEEQLMVKLDLKGRPFSRGMFTTLYYVVDGAGEEEDFFECCHTCESKADGIHSLSKQCNRAWEYRSRNDSIAKQYELGWVQREENRGAKNAACSTAEAVRETLVLSVQEKEAAICGAAKFVIKSNVKRNCQPRR
jgi:hypothetical protein